jgi:hypothetical protein
MDAAAANAAHRYSPAPKTPRRAVRTVESTAGFIGNSLFLWDNEGHNLSRRVSIVQPKSAL